MKHKNPNVRNVNKFSYYLEDCDCLHCKYYQGRKRGCKLEKCCCEDEKLDAVRNGRIKRRRGMMAWDG